jgi:hypothetical protein
MWFQWTIPERPWCLTDLPIDTVDEALFLAATRMTVHNGRKVKFWLSSWINGGSPALMYPDLYSHAKRKWHTVAEALHNDTWIPELLMHDLTAPLLADYMMLWILIEAEEFNPLDQAEDEILWTRSPDVSTRQG